MGFEPDASKEIINIGPDEGTVSVNVLAETIAKLLKFDLDPIYVGSRPKEVWVTNGCADKARKLLGYKTEYSLEQGLKEMIDWIKEKGVKPFDYSLPIEISNDKLPEVWKKKLI